MVQCMLIIICINSFTLLRLIYLYDRGVYYTLFIHMLTHISVPTLYFGGAIALVLANRLCIKIMCVHPRLKH